jgi:hypothetical protein
VEFYHGRGVGLSSELSLGGFPYRHLKPTIARAP